MSEVRWNAVRTDILSGLGYDPGIWAGAAIDEMRRLYAENQRLEAALAAHDLYAENQRLERELAEYRRVLFPAP